MLGRCRCDAGITPVNTRPVEFPSSSSPRLLRFWEGGPKRLRLFPFQPWFCPSLNRTVSNVSCFRKITKQDWAYPVELSHPSAPMTKIVVARSNPMEVKEVDSEICPRQEGKIQKRLLRLRPERSVETTYTSLGDPSSWSFVRLQSGTHPGRACSTAIRLRGLWAHKSFFSPTNWTQDNRSRSW